MEEKNNASAPEEEIKGQDAQDTENTGTQQVEPDAKESSDEYVQVKKSDIEDLKSFMKDQSEVIKKQGEEIRMLTEISDKARLFKWQNDNAGELIRTARIHVWDGMVVLGWANIKDEVGKDSKGVLREKQILRLYLDSGEDEPVQKEVEYLFYFQNVRYKECEVIEKSSSAQGEFFTLMADDGRKFKVDTKFIN